MIKKIKAIILLKFSFLMALWRMSCLCGSKWSAEHLRFFTKGTRHNAPNRHICGKVERERTKQSSSQWHKKERKGKRERAYEEETFTGGRTGKGNCSDWWVTWSADESSVHFYCAGPHSVAHAHTHTFPLSCIVILLLAFQPISGSRWVKINK